jgi:ribulose-5-phosphate 4-epimerase/fuculose-1-phosphate aldolase
MYERSSTERPPNTTVFYRNSEDAQMFIYNHSDHAIKVMALKIKKDIGFICQPIGLFA